MNNLATRSFLNALGTVAYITVVTQIIHHTEQFFSDVNQTLAPIAFLMLFVVSAAITGGLVLGKPALMYFNNQKMEAVKMFVYTIGWLALGVAIVLAASLIWK
jgi:hypothetical protein